MALLQVGACLHCAVFLFFSTRVCTALCSCFFSTRVCTAPCSCFRSRRGGFGGGETRRDAGATVGAAGDSVPQTGVRACVCVRVRVSGRAPSCVCV